MRILLSDRVRSALKREGRATAPTIAAGLGERVASIHSVLVRGVADGWCVKVGADGHADVYSLKEIPAAPTITMRSDEQFERELAERVKRIEERSIPEQRCACGRMYQIEGGDRCLSCAMRWESR